MTEPAQREGTVTTLFGLIDTARDPQLYGLVVASPERACLFGGPLKSPLERNAPYIAAVTPGTPLFTAWRDYGWGRSWGIYCRSALPLAEVRRHLRQFLQAQLPDGKVVLFRFTIRAFGGSICRPASRPSCNDGSPASMNTAPKPQTGGVASSTGSIMMHFR